MFRPQLFVFLFFVLFYACKTQSDLSKMDWVIGKWRVNESNSFEEWTKINDGLYRGKGYKVRKNDTLIIENIEIVKRENTIFYIPSVSDQNDGKEIEFKLVSKNQKKLIFENKAHDFPQRIIYIKTDENVIDAKIEGTKQGLFSEVKFKLNKVN